MTTRTLMIEGRQVPQARPRVTRNGTYNPRNVWREAIQWEASQVFRGFPLDQRICLSIGLYVKTLRGDCSNYQKAIEDALEGHAYRNDNQIDDVRVRRFRTKGEPYTAITVSVL